MEIDYEELFLCLLMGLCDVGLAELIERAESPEFTKSYWKEPADPADWRYYAHVERGNAFSQRKWMAQKIEYRMCEVFICEMMAQAARAGNQGIEHVKSASR